MATYTFDKFDYTDQDMIIPKNTIFYRGIDHQVPDVLRDVPLYIASKEIAQHYGHIYQLTTKRELKLIDFRKLKNLMRLVITSRSSCNEECKRCIFYLTIAFGLCSYSKQVELLENYVDYATKLVVDPKQLDLVKARIRQMKNINLEHTPLNPFEPEGVRVAETYIDGHVVLILRELFNGVYDGFISPRLFSPFHEGNLTHEEIVIFSPKDCMEISNESNIKSGSITTLLNLFYSSISIKYKTMFNRSILIKKGGNMYIDEDRNKFYEDSKLVKKAKALAKEFNKSYNIKSTSSYMKPSLPFHHPISFGGDC